MHLSFIVVSLPVHICEPQKRRGNLPVRSAKSHDLPGDSHASLGMTAVVGICPSNQAGQGTSLPGRVMTLPYGYHHSWFGKSCVLTLPQGPLCTGRICVYKNTRRLLTNVRVVWYNILNQIQTVEAEITVYVDPTESPGG